jgi:folate-binding protein YgfZ
METALPNEILDTPLAALHAGAGAEMGVWFGCGLPDDFGNAEAEFGFTKESVALLDKNYRAYLSFTGPDRVRYLNAILTNNIKDLAPAHGNVSLLLNPQGHILAEIETYAFADKLFCVSYAMIRERLIEWLDKYIIMDDVTLTDETARFGTLALEGPKAAAAVKYLTGIDLEPLGELASVDAEILRSAQDDNLKKDALQKDAVNAAGGGAIPCRIVKRSAGGGAGAEFVVDRDQLAPLWQLLLGAARKHGGGPAGYSALSARRLELGVPWFGHDFGEKQIPHEAGLQDSHISYTKGCYTGQEIVERVRSRGQVNRKRVRLIFSGDILPEAGTVLTADGKEMGYVTRAAKTWDPPAIIGMGYVRRESSAPDTRVEWAHGTATVATLFT